MNWFKYRALKHRDRARERLDLRTFGLIVLGELVGESLIDHVSEATFFGFRESDIGLGRVGAVEQI